MGPVKVQRVALNWPHAALRQSREVVLLFIKVFKDYPVIWMGIYPLISNASLKSSGVRVLRPKRGFGRDHRQLCPPELLKAGQNNGHRLRPAEGTDVSSKQRMRQRATSLQWEQKSTLGPPTPPRQLWDMLSNFRGIIPCAPGAKWCQPPDSHRDSKGNPNH